MSPEANTHEDVRRIAHKGEVAGHRFEVRGVPSTRHDGREVLDPDTYTRLQDLLVAEVIARGWINAETFRLLRKRAGYKAAEFGDLAGVSSTTVSNWERGIHPIPPTAWAVAAHLAIGADVREVLRAAWEPSQEDEPIVLQFR